MCLDHAAIRCSVSSVGLFVMFWLHDSKSRVVSLLKRSVLCWCPVGQIGISILARVHDVEEAAWQLGLFSVLHKGVSFVCSHGFAVWDSLEQHMQ